MSKQQSKSEKNPSISIESFSVRDRVMAASLKLFVEQGYFKTNVADISRESKCSIGSIYHAFKSKDIIAFELYKNSIASFREEIFRSIENIEDEEIILKTIVISFLEFAEINHQLSYYIWQCRHGEFMNETINHPTKIGFDTLGRKLTKTIRSAIKKNLIKERSANVIWAMLFGVPLSYVRDWLDGFNKIPPSKVAHEIADACLKGLK